MAQGVVVVKEEETQPDLLPHETASFKIKALI